MRTDMQITAKMLAMHLFALVATLLARGLRATPACSLPTQIKGNGYSGVCLGDQVTFTCNASSSATTALRWQSDVFGVIGPAYFGISDMASKSRVPYNLSIVETIPVAVLVSKAMTIVVSSLNGTTISCAETNNGATYTDISTGCINLAAPPSDPLASIASCTTNSVILQWTGSLFDGGSNLTNYTLTSSPPTPNCNGSCAVDPTSRQYTFSGLQPGVPYTLGVSGTNCGGTQQGAQNNISVTIPYPQPPFVCPVFDAATSNLIQVSSTWYPLRINTNSLLCGPAAMEGYNITYVGSDETADVYSIPATNCSSNCSHLLVVGTRNSSQYNVSVAGYGVLSTIQTIDSTNNILKVEVANWIQPVTINCTFLPGLVGTSGCVVSFGTSPDYLPYTSTSSQSGGSGQSVSVQLTINGAPLNPNTPYFYTASSTNPCVTVKGSFCPLGYLGTTSSNNCFCTGGNLSLDIPNGCVCYNGIMTGSQASVKCNAGYQLQGNSTLVCQGDGLWSGVQPMCSKQAPPTGSNSLCAGKIAGVVVGSVFAAFCIVAMMWVTTKMVYNCIIKKAEASKLEAAPIAKGMESSTELSSSLAQVFSMVPVPDLQPSPMNNAIKNEKEWEAIMSVVQEAASPAKV